MRKILVLLVISLFVLPVWGEESLALVSTLDANAEAIFGVDLGNDGSDIQTGFETSAGFTVKLDMVDASSEELGEGDFYGWIEIKDFKIEIKTRDQYPTKKDLTADGASPKIEAKPAVGIDEAKLKLQIDAAKLQVTTAQTSLTAAQTGLTTATNGLILAQRGLADATAALAAAKALPDTDATKATKVTAAETAHTAADAAVKTSTTGYTTATAGVTAATSGLAQAQAGVNSLENAKNLVGAISATAPAIETGIHLSWGEINAKLHFGDIYVNLRAAESGVDQASKSVFLINGASLSSTAGVKPETDTSNVHLAKTGMGIGVGYKFLDGKGTAELGLSSGYNGKKWHEANNSYLISGYVEVADLAGVTLKFNVGYWLNAKAKNATTNTDEDVTELAAGLLVQYSLPITDTITFRPALGFDAVMKDFADTSKLDMQAAIAANVIWPGLDDDEDTHLDFLPDKVKVTSGAGVGANLVIKGDGHVAKDKDLKTAVDVYVTFYEDGGTAGIVPFMGAELLANYTMLMDKKGNDIGSHFGLGLHTTYLVAENFTPFLGVLFQLQDLTEKGKTDAKGVHTEALSMEKRMNLELKAGLEISGVVPNTTFTFEYVSGNLIGGAAKKDNEDKNAWGDISAVRKFFNADNSKSNTNLNLGQFTAKAKVSF